MNDKIGILSHGSTLAAGAAPAAASSSRWSGWARWLRWRGPDAARAMAMAGPFDASDFARLVPPDKKLDPEWVRSLFARGERTVYRGDEPGADRHAHRRNLRGQLYLGGDGKLWHWDIFNRVEHTNEAHYANPMRSRSPLDQGFAVRIKSGDRTEIRTLDRAGFSDIRFRGEYPIGFVEYRDPASPVEVDLEAFSPFIPLNTDDSSLPATILIYRVKNVSHESRRGRAGRLARERRLPRHRPPGRRPPAQPGQCASRTCSCSNAPPSRPRNRPLAPAIVLADFEADLRQWTARGPAFGTRPAARRTRAASSGFQGKGWSTPGPAATTAGKLVSPRS